MHPAARVYYTLAYPGAKCTLTVLHRLGSGLGSAPLRLCVSTTVSLQECCTSGNLGIRWQGRAVNGPRVVLKLLPSSVCTKSDASSASKCYGVNEPRGVLGLSALEPAPQVPHKTWMHHSATGGTQLPFHKCIHRQLTNLDFEDRLDPLGPCTSKFADAAVQMVNRAWERKQPPHSSALDVPLSSSVSLPPLAASLGAMHAVKLLCS